ncbi:hypothetical protein AB0L75_42535 [Streptomyces sp. NPDC052101]|uniref:hypothetical protein n=1 Tax=Streptomyces sp. NPDC052101 TaxID=3155763 RepID=UPI00344ABB33
MSDQKPGRQQHTLAARGGQPRGRRRGRREPEQGVLNAVASQAQPRGVLHGRVG